MAVIPIFFAYLIFLQVHCSLSTGIDFLCMKKRKSCLSGIDTTHIAHKPGLRDFFVEATLLISLSRHLPILNSHFLCDLRLHYFWVHLPNLFHFYHIHINWSGTIGRSRYISLFTVPYFLYSCIWAGKVV